MPTIGAMSTQKRPTLRGTATRVLSVLSILRSTKTIYLGTRAEPGEFPYVVQVTSSRRDELVAYKCGGVIVSPNVVLTAAHCVDGSFGTKRNASEGYAESHKESAHVVQILAGETAWQRRDGGWSQERTAREVIIYPGYDDSMYPLIHNDVALLVLAHPLTFDAFVDSIRLPGHMQVFDGDAQICGWGDTGPGQSATKLWRSHTQIRPKADCVRRTLDLILNRPDVAREVKAMITATRENSTALIALQEDWFRSTICVFGTEPNASVTCQGDSGGPLVCPQQGGGGSPLVCGITSWMASKRCDEPEVPQLFAAVAQFTDWIHEQITKYTFTCSTQKFNCGDGACVPLSARCDDFVDCSYGTDEISCDPCPHGSFRCKTKLGRRGRGLRECVGITAVCDGTRDCHDGSDEFRCGADGSLSAYEVFESYVGVRGVVLGVVAIPVMACCFCVCVCHCLKLWRSRAEVQRREGRQNPETLPMNPPLERSCRQGHGAEESVIHHQMLAY